MHLHRTRRGVAVAGLAAAVVLSAVTATTSALAQPAETSRPTAGSVGAAGIGDPYFPRDGNGGYDVAHYSVRAAYDQRGGRLEGSTTLRAVSTQSLSRFNLDLLLRAESVIVNGRRASFTQSRHELVVRPDRPIASGASFRVRVTYAGNPAPLSYGGERNWLTDGRETVTMNQPHMAPWWFAANDHPSDKATFDIRITGRAREQVISNGTLVKRTVRPDGTATTHWRSVEPMATYLAFFAMGRYAVRTGTSDGLPYVAAVSRELPAGQRRKAMAAMLRSPEIVRWLETEVGPYPFSSTGGLTTGLEPGFALENQTRPTYPVLGKDRMTTVVHELAHQWFGDSVAIDGWRDIWLNEGLATYFEARYAETHGGPTAQSWLDRTYAQYARSETFWSVRLDDPGASRIFDTPIYVRGGMAAQALRTRIGDAAFSSLLRTWVAQHQGGNVTTAEFEALATQVSGVDLTSFFDAWLRGTVPPARTAANGFVL